MKINVASSSGFCFGVRRAITIALNAAGKGQEVVMLKDIVHNETVVRQLRKAGIKKISSLRASHDKALLISAHGTSQRCIKQAQTLGYSVIDATCPMVREIHAIACSMEKKGYRIIIIGDKKHDEVQGIVGDLSGKPIVIDTPSHIPVARIRPLARACVVVQSTQDYETVTKVMPIFNRHIRDLKFFNTVCKPTRIKQEDIKKLPLQNDVMIIIGSRNSANTKRLYEIARSKNDRTYWINSPREIRASWFKNARQTGLTAGASTPESTIEDIVRRIHAVTRKKTNRK